MDIIWNEGGTVSLSPVPKRVRKLTGTRFASVLGLNRWNTPFQTWCEITGAYRVPFEDTKYTLAGKEIEPKQIAYMREAYGMDDLRDPTDVYGPDPFSATYGNFFTDEVFGGMWDAILVDEDDEPTGVLEFKTTKRAQDWADDVPEYYALQAALYAWLLGVEDVIMVATFLEEGDYAHPEDFEVSAENTATFEFELHGRYPDFERDYIEPALAWWREHVEGGVSPEYDERADAEYLKPMRDASLNPDTDIEALMDEYETLVSQTEAKRKRIDEIKKQLKAFAMERIGDAETASFGNGRVECRLARCERVEIDKDALAKAGILEKYSKTAESIRFTVTIGK